MIRTGQTGPEVRHLLPAWWCRVVCDWCGVFGWDAHGPTVPVALDRLARQNARWDMDARTASGNPAHACPDCARRAAP